MKKVTFSEHVIMIEIERYTIVTKKIIPLHYEGPQLQLEKYEDEDEDEDILQLEPSEHDLAILDE